MPTARAPTRVLGDLADRQHGCFARRQILDAGISTGTIDRRIRHGDWVGVDHGVYRSVLTPETWSLRVMAACLAGPAAASHRSGCALWEVPGFDMSLVEVTARRHRRRARTDVVWHESRHLDKRDVTEVDGIPVTDPCRTLIDMGALLDHVGLAHLLDDLLRRRLVTTTDVLLRLDRLGPRRRGTRLVRRVVEGRADATPLPESAAETDFDLLLGRFGIPRPVRQLEVHDAEGLVGRLDFAYPDLRIDIEVDGRRFHGGPEARARDRRRDDRLEALGWYVLRLTADDLRFRPAWVADRIHTVRFRRRHVGGRG